MAPYSPLLDQTISLYVHDLRAELWSKLNSGELPLKRRRHFCGARPIEVNDRVAIATSRRVNYWKAAFPALPSLRRRFFPSNAFISFQSHSPRIIHQVIWIDWFLHTCRSKSMQYMNQKLQRNVVWNKPVKSGKFQLTIYFIDTACQRQKKLCGIWSTLEHINIRYPWV